MAAEADKTKETPKPEEAAQAKTGGLLKSGLFKYLLFGAGGLVAVLAVAFGTLMLLGNGQSASDQSAEVNSESASNASGQPESSDSAGDSQTSGIDSIEALMEQGGEALDEMMAAIQALDFVPADQIPTAELLDVAGSDSAQAVNWIEQEKTRLADREKELNAREKQLNVRESQVKQKMLVLEQAESTRIAKLAKLYDGMDAGAVARLIANLDDETVVALLPRMNTKNASAVMALMPPVRGARLSKQMITIAEN
jgi:flagellar motility protein MotE (MotC chaperone)